MTPLIMVRTKEPKTAHSSFFFRFFCDNESSCQCNPQVKNKLDTRTLIISERDLTATKINALLCIGSGTLMWTSKLTRTVQCSRAARMEINAATWEDSTVKCNIIR